MMTGPNIAVFGFLAIIIILLGFAAVILLRVISGTISLDGLISEPVDPKHPNLAQKASLSRFQFLIFTFVIAGLYLILCIEAGTFIEIPANVLGLLGISGGSFVVSKAVGSQKDAQKKKTGGGNQSGGNQSDNNADEVEPNENQNQRE